MAKMGRPAKVIDKKIFENLCSLQCTEEEFCAAFDVTDKTLSNWCKRTYGCTFSEAYKQKRGAGKISLRRAQFQLAQKNASMAIWLGKQYLNQTDSIQNVSMEIEDDGLLEALGRSQNKLVFDGDMIDSND